ncbi:MAG: hypothetical protein JW888_01975 [Pirellulales bacterium]|nr:hypothetical protein [Pirellulales bacterium]
MNPVTFPIAAIGDLLGVAFVIIAGLVSVIGQIMAKQREQKAAAEKAARRGAAGGRPAPGPVVAQPAQPKRPANLEDEIGEFLRRAARGRAGQDRPVQARPAQAPGRPNQPRPVQARPAQIPVAAEIVEPAPHPVGGKVEAVVAKELDTSRFKKRAHQLGKRTREVSKQLEQRVSKKFDRELGKLGGQIARPAPPKKKPVTAMPVIPATGAAGFAAMLRDVHTVRQAVILSEILSRPIDRWS